MQDSHSEFDYTVHVTPKGMAVQSLMKIAGASFEDALRITDPLFSADGMDHVAALAVPGLELAS